MTVPSGATSAGTIATAGDAATAAELERIGGRRIPAEEWKRFVPQRPVPLAAFEAKPHTQFVRPGATPAHAGVHGDHGFWPLREDYRSTFILWGPGVRRARLGEIDMLTIAGRLAGVLGIPFGKETQ